MPVRILGLFRRRLQSRRAVVGIVGGGDFTARARVVNPLAVIGADRVGHTDVVRETRDLAQQEQRGERVEAQARGPSQDALEQSIHLDDDRAPQREVRFIARACRSLVNVRGKTMQSAGDEAAPELRLRRRAVGECRIARPLTVVFGHRPPRRRKSDSRHLDAHP